MRVRDPQQARRRRAASQPWTVARTTQVHRPPALPVLHAVKMRQDRRIAGGARRRLAKRGERFVGDDPWRDARMKALFQGTAPVPARTIECSLPTSRSADSNRRCARGASSIGTVFRLSAGCRGRSRQQLQVRNEHRRGPETHAAFRVAIPAVRAPHSPPLTRSDEARP